jgi:hypothetical protein
MVRSDWLRRRSDLRFAESDLVTSSDGWSSQTWLLRPEWTDAVSQAYGRIKAALERRGTCIEDFDAAIAAHALATSATLVTANLDHMARARYACRIRAQNSGPSSRGRHHAPWT